MVHKYYNLWIAFFKNCLTRDMEFKMNFIGDLFVDAIFYGSMYFFWSVIFLIFYNFLQSQIYL